MSPGPAIRRLLGSRLASHAGRWYRAIFVNLAKEAAALATVIPRDAHVLDVGGGDGQPLNHLLALRSDLKITTLDPGPVVGQWIEERFKARVILLPNTSIADYLAIGGANPDVILIADVMHHIPENSRSSFLSSIRVLLERVPHLRIIVKDVEPGSWRAVLGYWSDLYVTGDRNVSLISRARLAGLFEDALGPMRRRDTDLFETDRPNYAIAFYR